MVTFLMCDSGLAQPLPDSALGPPSLPDRRAQDAAMVDVEGILRQASVRVNVQELLRSGKKNLHLLSRDRIDELIDRAVRSIVEKCAAAGTPAESALRKRMESGPRQEHETLRGQMDQTAKAFRSVETDLERTHVTVLVNDKDIASMLGGNAVRVLTGIWSNRVR